ncbi:protransforming growth factor alpha-like [Bufo gargarizans]|uniref:protransforming growth factor alpha-like n=1 Tax=Bufo gargarizans TaxID=30331 RepID=UPI001CF1BBE2|nr:protransforming growth factor alpha-like [Bufo gargarizans]
MLGGVLFAVAAYFIANASSEILFAECPDAYTHFCFHGTCRFLVAEWTASCICFKGYIGSRCQKMDLLQVMAGDPRSVLVVALTLLGSTCLVIYLYRRKAQSKLTLLKNIDAHDV